MVVGLRMAENKFSGPCLNKRMLGLRRVRNLRFDHQKRCKFRFAMGSLFLCRTAGGDEHGLLPLGDNDKYAFSEVP